MRQTARGRNKKKTKTTTTTRTNVNSTKSKLLTNLTIAATQATLPIEREVRLVKDVSALYVVYRYTKDIFVPS